MGLLRWYLQKLNKNIDDMKMIAHFLSSLPEACDNIIGNLEENLTTKIFI